MAPRTRHPNTGTDELIHVVTVRTANLIYKRLIVKLCALQFPLNLNHAFTFASYNHMFLSNIYLL